MSDRVTSESHATQLAREREAGDAKEEERLRLSPPSKHIAPAAKHTWEDRSSGGAGAEAGPVCRVRGGVGFGPGVSVGVRGGTRRRRPRRGRDSRRSTRRSRRWRRSSGEPTRPHGAKRSGAVPRRSGTRSGKPAERLSAACPGAWSYSSHTWPTWIRSGTWTATTRRPAGTSMRPSTPRSRTRRVSAGFATCCRTGRPTPGSVGRSAGAAGGSGRRISTTPSRCESASLA